MAKTSASSSAEMASEITRVPRPPRHSAICSASAYQFQRQHVRVFDFFFFSVGLSTRADKIALTAAEALASTGSRNAEDIERLEGLRANPNPFFKKMQSFSHYNSDIIIIRSVDNYLSYLSDILQSCMIKRPELLKSKDQIKLEDILQFSNFKELIQYLVDRKLNDLVYSGLNGIEEFIENRLGLSLLYNDKERALLALSIECRNISTHNRGIVNDIMLNRLRKFPDMPSFVKGKRFGLDYDKILELTNNLFDVALRLDERACNKFGIKRKRYVTWKDHLQINGR